MKRILITISGLQFDRNEGAKNRLNSFINSYKKEGYEVDVLLFFSLRSLSSFLIRKKFLNENANWFLFPAIPISYSILITKLSILVEQIIFFIISRIKKYDLIQSEIRGEIGKYKPRGSFFIVDFHGDSVSETEFINERQPNWLSNYFLKIQKKSLIYADHVIAVSQNLILRLNINTAENILNFDIISCGVEVERFENPNVIEVPWANQDRIILGYLGGLQKWQNVESILDIFLNLRLHNSQLFFVLYTNDSVDSIQHKLDLIGSDNYFIKPLNSNEISDYVNLLDAGFLIREDLTLNIVSSPTKIVEYLASGVPVVCTQFSGDYNRSINHTVEGFVIEDIIPTNTEALTLIDYLLDIKKNREKYRQVCKNAALKRSWSYEFDAYFEGLDLKMNSSN